MQQCSGKLLEQILVKDTQIHRIFHKQRPVHPEYLLNEIKELTGLFE